ncbi:MAG: hypothetical protein ABH817_00645 [archaeon]
MPVRKFGESTHPYLRIRLEQASRTKPWRARSIRLSFPAEHLPEPLDGGGRGCWYVTSHGAYILLKAFKEYEISKYLEGLNTRQKRWSKRAESFI